MSNLCSCTLSQHQTVTDALHPPPPGAVKLKGYWAEKIEIGVENHLKKLHYPAMVDYFRTRPNPFASGEFWGKTLGMPDLSIPARPEAEGNSRRDSSGLAFDADAGWLHQCAHVR